MQLSAGFVSGEHGADNAALFQGWAAAGVTINLLNGSGSVGTLVPQQAVSDIRLVVTLIGMAHVPPASSTSFSVFDAGVKQQLAFGVQVLTDHYLLATTH